MRPTCLSPCFLRLASGAFFGFIILGVSLKPKVAWADEFHPLFRNARAEAMGDAYTAVADDEGAIFYNSANLAENKGFSFKLAATSLDVSNDLLSTYSNFTSLFGSFELSSLNTLLGKNYYGQAGVYASLTGPSFGVSAIYDLQVAVRLKNKAFPQGTLGAQRTYGAQFAFGIPLAKAKKKSWALNFGMAGKVLWRAGGYSNLSLTDILTLNSSEFTQKLQNYGIGLGVDMGFQYVYRFAPMFTFLAGLSATDLGDTSFTQGNDSQKSNLTSGLGIKYKAGDVKALLSYDYNHLLENWDWRLKSHLGLELGFSLLRLDVGMNETYLTYGAGLNLAIISLMYVHYVEEQSAIVGTNPEPRTMVYAALKFDL